MEARRYENTISLNSVKEKLRSVGIKENSNIWDSIIYCNENIIDYKLLKIRNEQRFLFSERDSGLYDGEGRWVGHIDMAMSEFEKFRQKYCIEVLTETLKESQEWMLLSRFPPAS